MWLPTNDWSNQIKQSLTAKLQQQGAPWQWIRRRGARWRRQIWQGGPRRVQICCKYLLTQWGNSGLGLQWRQARVRGTLPPTTAGWADPAPPPLPHRYRCLSIPTPTPPPQACGSANGFESGWLTSRAWIHHPPASEARIHLLALWFYSLISFCDEFIEWILRIVISLWMGYECQGD